MYSSGFNVRDDGYQVYVSSIARISDAYVLVTAADGQVILSADGNTLQTGSTGYTLPQSVVAQVQKDGRFTGITTLGGLFPEKLYVAGTPVQVTASRAKETRIIPAIITNCRLYRLFIQPRPRTYSPRPTRSSGTIAPRRPPASPAGA